MNRIIPAVKNYIRFHLDLFIFANNLIFSLVFLLLMPLLATGAWALYAVFVLLLFRTWIIVKRYCSQIHGFPVFYFSTPFTPLVRLIGIFIIVLFIFPLFYILVLLFFHSVFYLSGLISFPVSSSFYLIITGQLMSWSSIMFFAALYWKKSQFMKLVSVLLALLFTLVLIAYFYIRSRYSEYFSSLFVISNLEGFFKSVRAASSGSSGQAGSSFLSVLLGCIWYFLVPVLMFRLSLSRLKKYSILNMELQK